MTRSSSSSSYGLRRLLRGRKSNKMACGDASEATTESCVSRIEATPPSDPRATLGPATRQADRRHQAGRQASPSDLSLPLGSMRTLSGPICRRECVCGQLASTADGHRHCSDSLAVTREDAF